MASPLKRAAQHNVRAISMTQCPHCGAPAMSAWRKQILGPGRSVACEHCSKPVSVDKKRAWLLISLILIMGLGGRLLFESHLGWLIGLIFVAPLYHFYVPLVPAKP